MSKTLRFFTILLFSAMMSSIANAGEESEGKVSGYMFGDYYYQFSNPDTSVNYNGFQFRRIYFNYDNGLSETFAVRFRMELKSEEGKNITPFIKNAYLAWKNLIPNSTIYFGAQGTPTKAVSEKIWGYRSVEKTITDLRGAASSSDLGIGIKGKLSESGTLSYHILVANGEGKKGEDNQYKKVYLSIPVKLAGNFDIVPYVDYEGGDNDMTKLMYAAFVGYKDESFQGGVELFQKTHAKAAAKGNDLISNGVSVFGSVKVAENIRAFGRFDIFDENTDVDNDANNYIVAGFDVEIEKGVNLIPNIKIESYEMSGLDPLAVGSLTFFYRF